VDGAANMEGGCNIALLGGERNGVVQAAHADRDNLGGWNRRGAGISGEQRWLRWLKSNSRIG
jgi:hypothetical protein